MFSSEGFKGNPISRLEFLKRAAIILAGFFFSTLSWGVLVGRYRFKKQYVSIKLPRWPKNYPSLKVVQISDLHLGGFDSVQKLEEGSAY